jgi:hypothetical protein
MNSRNLEDYNTKYIKFEQSEQQKKKRLQKKYNSLHKEWQEDISSRQEQFAMLSSRKACEDIARKERMHEMMAKLKRSQK